MSCSKFAGVLEVSPYLTQRGVGSVTDAHSPAQHAGLKKSLHQVPAAAYAEEHGDLTC